MSDSLVDVLGWREALAGQVGYWPIYASAWPAEMGIALICAAVAFDGEYGKPTLYGFAGCYWRDDAEGGQ